MYIWEPSRTLHLEFAQVVLRSCWKSLSKDCKEVTVASIAPFINQNNNAEALIVILFQLLNNWVLSLSLWTDERISVPAWGFAPSQTRNCTSIGRKVHVHWTTLDWWIDPWMIKSQIPFIYFAHHNNIIWMMITVLYLIFGWMYQLNWSIYKNCNLILAKVLKLLLFFSIVLII